MLIFIPLPTPHPIPQQIPELYHHCHRIPCLSPPCPLTFSYALLNSLTSIRYADWVKQLETQKQQFPTSTNDDAVVPKQKKATLLNKAKKNITGKVVSSSVGRDALKSILDDDTRESFNIFKQLLVSEFGEEKAATIEGDMVNLVVKAYPFVISILFCPFISLFYSFFFFLILDQTLCS